MGKRKGDTDERRAVKEKGNWGGGSGGFNGGLVLGRIRA